MQMKMHFLWMNLQIVAIKQLDRNGLQGNREFLVEVLMLSLLQHENLVNLIGYCAEGDQRLLVYEYMPLGSLEDHLHGEMPKGSLEDHLYGTTIRFIFTNSSLLVNTILLYVYLYKCSIIEGL